jgi:hypothetical protein
VQKIAGKERKNDHRVGPANAVGRDWQLHWPPIKPKHQPNRPKIQEKPKRWHMASFLPAQAPGNMAREIELRQVLAIYSSILVMGLFSCGDDGGGNGNLVSPEEAVTTAVNWMELNYPERSDFEVSHVDSDGVEGDVVSYRVQFAAGGFVIVSAKSTSRPIIGYSDVGTLEGADDPLIGALAASATHDEGGGADWSPLNNPNARRAPKSDSQNDVEVEPLLQTEWGQSGGYHPNFTYNGFTPYVTDRDRAPVGCITVAFGQMLKYYDYPKMGQLTNRYCSTGQSIYNCWNGETVETTFNTRYRWDEMPPSLNYSSSKGNVNAVAQLLYDVGRSMDIVYGEHGSNIQIEKPSVFRAFRRHFRLPDVKMIRRDDYSETEWEELISNEIRNGRPVVFSGYDSGVNAGHAYVLDGLRYSTFVAPSDAPNSSKQETVITRFVHVNWGWGGSANGYYDIKTLFINNRYSFTEDLVAFINFTPETVEPKGRCNGPGGLRCSEGLMCALDDDSDKPAEEAASDEFGTCQWTPKTECFSGTVGIHEWARFGPFETKENIAVTMTGGGDADLYVRRSETPNDRDFQCSPQLPGSEEECELEGAGTYFLAVYGYADGFSDFELCMTYQP